jgi:phosphoadenosine phosphosulfate reductase
MQVQPQLNDQPSQDSEPEALIEWAARAHPGRAVLSVSFGGGGLVLAHIVSRVAPEIPVAFLDTGFHFAETYAFRNAVTSRFGLRRLDVEPTQEVGPLFRVDPDRCCYVRKVEPMARLLEHADVWITALRRDQSVERRGVARAEALTLATGRRITKLNPLADWTAAEIERYLVLHRLPRHPLSTRGYRSIGCWPCTRPAEVSGPERSGRWQGTAKTECGLHGPALGEAVVG